MVFQLIITGLCAFVLSPCKKNTTSVSAVFPGGPFKFSNTEKYPEHHPTLTVDVTDVDPMSTAMPMYVIEQPDGTQFAVYEVSGEITLKIDGKTPAVKAGNGFQNVANLAEVVNGKPEIGELRKDLLRKNPNKYSRAHLTLPYDANGAELTANTTGQFDFPTGTKNVADRVTARWDNVAQSAIFKDRKGKTIILRDSPTGDGVNVVISSFSHHLGMATNDLAHFPSYYVLSRHFKELKKADRAVPKKHQVMTGNVPPEGIKPVLCAICQGCQG